MTIKKLATTYLRYWVQSHGEWTVADNAPAEVWHLCRRHPNMLHYVLELIAYGSSHEIPNTETLLRKTAFESSFVALCDTILAGRQAPKTVGTLLRQAYLAQIDEIKSKVQADLQTEISKYNS